MRVVVFAVVGFGLACCSAPARNFSEKAGGAGGLSGASTATGGSAGRNVQGQGGGAASHVGGAAGAEPDTTAAGAAGIGEPDDTSEAGAAGAGPDTAVDCTASQYHDGASCHALTVCGTTEFEQSPPKPDQDRVCAKLTQCSAN
jgi:hypothetical protein